MAYSKDSALRFEIIYTIYEQCGFAVMMLTSILEISSPSSSLSGFRLISKQ